MASIWVSPDVVDKAMIVVVHEAHSALAVWKGRSRIDVYDLAGEWHRIVQPYAPEEEGLWSRDDLLVSAAETLVAAKPPTTVSPRPDPALHIDVDRLAGAWLVRAEPSGYALWNGAEDVDVFAPDGTHVCWAKVPSADVPHTSQLMVELLELTPRLAA
jgi:hypothetical protein